MLSKFRVTSKEFPEYESIIVTATNKNTAWEKFTTLFGSFAAPTMHRQDYIIKQEG